jgi:hypothetical protein
MNGRFRAFAIATALTASLSAAQWLKYPTPGVPKTPSGLPNLGAPAPRTADGKMDFSGMWEADNRPCPPGGCNDMPLSAQFLDIGEGLKGGLPYQPWAADAVKQRTAIAGQGDHESHCLPSGVPRMLWHPTFRRIVQFPDLLLFLNERNLSYRQIFTDGRPLPADPQPSWNGYSTGRWDGDTLVVETNGLRDGLWLDRKGDPLTSAARVTERFRRPNYGNLEVDVTIDDPKAYTKPWTTTVKQFIVLNTELLAYFCNENERDVAHFVAK